MSHHLNKNEEKWVWEVQNYVIFSKKDNAQGSVENIPREIEFFVKISISVSIFHLMKKI